MRLTSRQEESKEGKPVLELVYVWGVVVVEKVVVIRIDCSSAEYFCLIGTQNSMHHEDTNVQNTFAAGIC